MSKRNIFIFIALFLYLAAFAYADDSIIYKNLVTCDSLNSGIIGKSDCEPQISLSLLTRASLIVANIIKIRHDYGLFSGKLYDAKRDESKIAFEFYNGTYSICENDNKMLPILVVNKENFANRYFLEAFGSGWISLNIKEFSLQRNQSGVVFLSLMPKQGSSASYIIKLNAVSLPGNTKKSISMGINVKKCYSLIMNLENEKDNACGGTKRQYAGELINDGEEKVNVKLSIDAPYWVTLSENLFSIDAHSRQKFRINADIPSNATGIFDVFVSAQASGGSSSYIKQEKSLKIEAMPKYDCYKADIISNPKVKNYYSNEYFAVKIRNIGISPAEYSLSLQAPDWVSIEPNKLSINPDKFATINLNINPSAEAAKGAYPIKIIAQLDEIEYSKNVSIVLKKENKILKALKEYFGFYKYFI